MESTQIDTEFNPPPEQPIIEEQPISSSNIQDYLVRTGYALKGYKDAIAATIPADQVLDPNFYNDTNPKSALGIINGLQQRVSLFQQLTMDEITPDLLTDVSALANRSLDLIASINESGRINNVDNVSHMQTILSDMLVINKFLYKDYNPVAQIGFKRPQRDDKPAEIYSLYDSYKDSQIGAQTLRLLTPTQVPIEIESQDQVVFDKKMIMMMADQLCALKYIDNKNCGSVGTLVTSLLTDKDYFPRLLWQIGDSQHGGMVDTSFTSRFKFYETEATNDTLNVVLANIKNDRMIPPMLKLTALEIMDYATNGKVIGHAENDMLGKAYKNDILSRDMYFNTRQNKLELRDTLNLNVMIKKNVMNDQDLIRRIGVTTNRFQSILQTTDTGLNIDICHNCNGEIFTDDYPKCQGCGCGYHKECWAETNCQSCYSSRRPLTQQQPPPARQTRQSMIPRAEETKQNRATSNLPKQPTALKITSQSRGIKKTESVGRPLINIAQPKYTEKKLVGKNAQGEIRAKFSVIKSLAKTMNKGMDQIRTDTQQPLQIQEMIDETMNDINQVIIPQISMQQINRQSDLLQSLQNSSQQYDNFTKTVNYLQTSILDQVPSAERLQHIKQLNKDVEFIQKSFPQDILSDRFIDLATVKQKLATNMNQYRNYINDVGDLELQTSFQQTESAISAAGNIEDAMWPYRDFNTKITNFRLEMNTTTDRFEQQLANFKTNQVQLEQTISKINKTEDLLTDSLIRMGLSDDTIKATVKSQGMGSLASRLALYAERQKDAIVIINDANKFRSELDTLHKEFSATQKTDAEYQLQYRNQMTKLIGQIYDRASPQFQASVASTGTAIINLIDNKAYGEAQRGFKELLGMVGEVIKSESQMVEVEQDTVKQLNLLAKSQDELKNTLKANAGAYQTLYSKYNTITEQIRNRSNNSIAILNRDDFMKIDKVKAQLAEVTQLEQDQTNTLAALSDQLTKMKVQRTNVDIKASDLSKTQERLDVLQQQIDLQLEQAKIKSGPIFRMTMDAEVLLGGQMRVIEEEIKKNTNLSQTKIKELSRLQDQNKELKSTIGQLKQTELLLTQEEGQKILYLSKKQSIDDTIKNLISNRTSFGGLSVPLPQALQQRLYKENIPELQNVSTIKGLAAAAVKVYQNSTVSKTDRGAITLKEVVMIDDPVKMQTVVDKQIKTFTNLQFVKDHGKNPLLVELAADVQQSAERLLTSYYTGIVYLARPPKVDSIDPASMQLIQTQRDNESAGILASGSILQQIFLTSQQIKEASRKTDLWLSQLDASRMDVLLGQYRDSSSYLNFQNNVSQIGDSIKVAAQYIGRAKIENSDFTTAISKQLDAIAKNSQQLIESSLSIEDKDEYSERISAIGTNLYANIKGIVERRDTNQFKNNAELLTANLVDYMQNSLLRVASRVFSAPGQVRQQVDAISMANILSQNNVLTSQQVQSIEADLGAFLTKTGNEFSEKLMDRLATMAGNTVVPILKQMDSESLVAAFRNQKEARKVMSKAYDSRTLSSSILDYSYDVGYLKEELKQQRDLIADQIRDPAVSEPSYGEPVPELFTQAYGGIDNKKNFFKGSLSLMGSASKDISLLGQVQLLSYGKVREKILTSSVTQATQFRDQTRRDKQEINNNTDKLINIKKDNLTPSENQKFLRSIGGIFSFFTSYIIPEKIVNARGGGGRTEYNNYNFQANPAEPIKDMTSDQLSTFSLDFLSNLPDTVGAILALPEAKIKNGSPLQQEDFIQVLALDEAIEMIASRGADRIARNEDLKKQLSKAFEATQHTLGRMRNYEQELVDSNNTFLKSVDDLLEQRITQHTDIDSFQKVNKKVQDYQEKQQAFIESNINRMGLQALYKSDPQLQQLARQQTMPGLIPQQGQPNKVFAGYQQSPAAVSGDRNQSRISDVVLDKVASLKKISDDDLMFVKRVRFDGTTKKLLLQIPINGVVSEKELTADEKKRFLRLVILIYLTVFSVTIRQLSKTQQTEAQNRLYMVYQRQDKMDTLFKMIDKMEQRIGGGGKVVPNPNTIQQVNIN